MLKSIYDVQASPYLLALLGKHLSLFQILYRFLREVLG